MATAWASAWWSLLCHQNHSENQARGCKPTTVEQIPVSPASALGHSYCLLPGEPCHIPTAEKMLRTRPWSLGSQNHGILWHLPPGRSLGAPSTPTLNVSRDEAPTTSSQSFSTSLPGEIPYQSLGCGRSKSCERQGSLRNHTRSPVPHSSRSTTGSSSPHGGHEKGLHSLGKLQGLYRISWCTFNPNWKVPNIKETKKENLKSPRGGSL